MRGNRFEHSQLFHLFTFQHFPFLSLVVCLDEPQQLIHAA